MGHSYEVDYTDAPTCTENGTATYTCSVCGDSYSEEIEANGHSYTETVTESTCTEKGFTTHSCSNCDDSYVDNYVDALGHNFVAGKVVKPTPTAQGYTISVLGRGFSDVAFAFCSDRECITLPEYDFLQTTK